MSLRDLVFFLLFSLFESCTNTYLNALVNKVSNTHISELHSDTIAAARIPERISEIISRPSTVLTAKLLYSKEF